MAGLRPNTRSKTCPRRESGRRGCRDGGWTDRGGQWAWRGGGSEGGEARAPSGSRAPPRRRARVRPTLSSSRAPPRRARVVPSFLDARRRDAISTGRARGAAAAARLGRVEAGRAHKVGEPRATGRQARAQPKVAERDARAQPHRAGDEDVLRLKVAVHVAVTRSGEGSQSVCDTSLLDPTLRSRCTIACAWQCSSANASWRSSARWRRARR